MIPSFAPIHEYFRAARGAAVPTAHLNDPVTGLESFTIDQLADAPANQAWRFIDGPHINYLSLVEGEKSLDGLIRFSPLTAVGGPINWTGPGEDSQGKPTVNAIPRTPTVAVIGAGMSGLLTALQLRKAGMAVTVYEAYGNPAEVKSSEVPGALTGRGHAGRVFPVNIDQNEDNGQVPSTQSQLGCMRFPRKSPLFWWYLRASGGVAQGTTFPQFPNPAVVPSVITGFAPVNNPGLGGSCTPVWNNAAIWPAAATASADPSPYQLPTEPYDYQQLNQRHLDAFLNYTPPRSPYSLRDIAGRLATTPDDPDDADAQVTLLNTFWDAAITELYFTRYSDFLVTKGFDPEEIERIGSVGLGTGGFSPLFGVCVLDIMRIVLWDYSDELSVPNLGGYPIALMAAFFNAWNAQVGGDQEPLYNTPVESVYWKPNVPVVGSAGSYTVIPKGSTGGYRTFDYVVLAMTHTAALDLLNKSASAPPPIGAQVPYTGIWLSDIEDGLRYQNIMKSTKIFQLIKGPAATFQNHKKTPPGWPAVTPPASGDGPGAPYDHRIRTLYGAFDSTHAEFYVPLGVTFLQPLLGQGFRPANLGASTQVNALHYSWGYGADDDSDSDLVKNMLTTNLSAAKALARSGCYQGIATYGDAAGHLGTLINEAMLMRSSNFPTYDLTVSAKSIVKYFAKSRTDNQSADLLAIYWHDVPYVWGGFKLDAPGAGAHLTFAYKVLAESTPAKPLDPYWDARVQDFDGSYFYSVAPAARGMFFAGDSFSNYGGWVEGAFQSALATSAGIIKQAHNDRWNGGARDDSQLCLDDRTGPNVLTFYNQTAIDALVTNARDPYSAVYNRGVEQ